jgi:predicted double-glycine peptidase
LTWGRQICEPGKATVLDDEELGALSASQPWERVWRWHDASYQFALCAKGPTAMRPRIRALAAGAPSAA